MDYIPDGEIHKLDKDYGYILSVKESFTIEELQEVKEKFIRIYTDYILNELEKNGLFSIIYRPEYLIKDLNQPASFGLKFKINPFKKINEN